MTWKIIHDTSMKIWIAYNKETLTCHLLQDQTQEVWDPDPLVPQDIIEMWRKIKEDLGGYPASDKTAGFKSTSNNEPDNYESFCWHIHPVLDKDGNDIGTCEALFPPTMRNDIYGGKTATEIRSMAFERYNKLVKQYGAANVTTKMIERKD